MSSLTQPLKWHGGKHYLAKRIIELMPPHIHYVEPYFGGGSVLLQKPGELIEWHSEVVNDLNGELMNFWNVLRSPTEFGTLTRFLSATPFAQDEFRRILKHDMRDSPIGRAWQFFVRYRQSRQGLGKDFATLSRNRTRRGMNEQVSSWLTAIDGLPEVHKRLKRVVILNDDAVNVIRQQDGENTLFYCDPPYLHETRVTTNDYEFEMAEMDHTYLLDALADIKGKFLLSGYRNSIYDRYAIECGWNRVDIEIDNKASSKATKDKKVECVWMNYEKSRASHE